MGMEAYIEEDIPDEDKTRLEKLSEKPVLLTIVFIAFIVYGAISVMFDWLWVSDMLNVQEALVFGPPSTATTTTLIIIASIGTVAFGFEISNFVKKVKTGEELIPEDIAKLISLFTEEVPSITLNYLLASCREVPVSYYAMVKAALAMVGAGLRVFSVFLEYFNPKNRKRRRRFFPWLFRMLILTACVYNFAGAICVWIFTYQEPPESEDGGFRPPDSISKSYDTDRYLYKAGVFLWHPNFATCQGVPPTNDTTRVNWLQLVSIYDVTDGDGELVTSTFAYDDNENYLYTQVPVVDRSGIIGIIESCFHTSLTGACSVNQISDMNQCQSDIEAMENKMRFTFYSVPRTKTIVFGDVKVNISLTTSKPSEPKTCNYLQVDTIGKLTLGNATVGQMKYHRIKQDVNDSYISNFLLDPPNTYKYYTYEGPPDETINKEDPLNQDIEQDMFMFRKFDFSSSDQKGVKAVDNSDLLSVQDEWKTGYKRCDMTGSLRPNPVQISNAGCDRE